MVGESIDERASLDDITNTCRQHPLEGMMVEEEVDKLVTYVMGAAPEVITCQHQEDFVIQNCQFYTPPHLASPSSPHLSMATQTWMMLTWNQRYNDKNVIVEFNELMVD